jgi:hypothetical protein
VEALADPAVRRRLDDLSVKRFHRAISKRPRCSSRIEVVADHQGGEH